MYKSYLIPLLNLDTATPVGTKMLNLYFLTKKAFDVPQTYCIMASAYNDFIIENKIKNILTEILADNSISHRFKSQKITDLIINGTISQRLKRALSHHDSLNCIHTKWAVRSSSNQEDLAKTSFAGLYDTFLNINGLDNILDTMKKCWASLWSERALVYREKNNLCQSEATMSVIIQEMVNSKYAGVIFTKSPYHENQNEIFLEYCEGVGERLVSGEITPYSCQIDRSSLAIHHWKTPQRKMLGDDDIRKLSKLAIKIEDLFGSPQDIEWAFDGKTIFFLQSRPIPNLSKFDPLPKDGVWTRANIGEVLPNVITPLTWEIFIATLMNRPELALKQSENNLIIDDGVKRIHGKGYIRLDFFLDSFCCLPFVTPEVMSRVLGTNFIPDDQTYKQPSGSRVRLSQILFILNALSILPRLSWMEKKLPSLPCKKRSNIESIIKWNAHCFRLHLKCTAYSIGAFALLSHLLEWWLPSVTENLLPLILIGNENLQTAVQGVSLRKLSNYVSENKDLTNILKTEIDWSVIAHKITTVDGGPQFLSMLQMFLDANGARAAGEFELAVPRWREDPSFVVNVIKKFLDTLSIGSNHHDSKMRHSQRHKAISYIKSSLGPLQRLLFSQLLKSYSNFCTLRENVKYRLMEGYAIIRDVFLEIGAHLNAKGVLESADDIFYLRPSEIVTRLEGDRHKQKTKELISERKAQHCIWEAQDAPNLIVIDGKEDFIPKNGDLSGIGCSPGIVNGIARVLSDISEADTLKPGEILVAPYTDPGWTPLFLNCRAVITEIGGFLSHGATVAREYGIPAVVNVSGATKKIKTGDLIRVNGSKGMVTFPEEKNSY
jgi:pyruvate,water dikinase